MKSKGILEVKCDMISKGKVKTDNDFLQESIKQIKDLSGATSIQGKQIMNTPYLRGYNITVNFSEGDQKFLIAFVWTLLNSAVLNFLVMAAKKDSINGIIGITEHVCVVKEYKLQAGPAMM